MAKTLKEPKEKMRMNIELADNGIIIRNLENEDEVTIAQKAFDFHNDNHDNEYKAIGQKVYDWLLDAVIPEHEDELIITNFDIDVVATLKGRPME